MLKRDPAAAWNLRVQSRIWHALFEPAAAAGQGERLHADDAAALPATLKFLIAVLTMLVLERLRKRSNFYALAEARQVETGRQHCGQHKHAPNFSYRSPFTV